MKTLIPRLFSKNDSDNWLSFLDENGYVVISDVLDNEEIKKSMDLFYKDWSYVSPNFKFDDKTTWTTDNSPMMWSKGMIYSSGLGQSDFQWYLRTRKDIIDIWKHIHKTDELVVSFDGFSVFLSKRQKPKYWLHVDQANSECLYSIQGAYNFFPVTDNDAGFVVVPKSHKTFKSENNKTKNFIIIDPDNEHVQQAVKLIIPKNCFVLWNSKTIHANTGMNKKDEFNRLTSYITYFPKQLRSKQIKEQRLQSYKNADNCSHWSIYNHIKKHPFGLKKRYENRNFNTIIPRLDNDESIPKERYIYI